jgi:hypothetical protein
VPALEQLLAILLAPLGRVEVCLPLLLDAQPGEDLAAYCGRQEWTWERLEAEASSAPIQPRAGASSAPIRTQTEACPAG